MRPNALLSSDAQPFAVVVVHNKADNLPIFALSNYGVGGSDSDTVMLDGWDLPLVLQVEDLEYTEARPSGLGLGLHRREATFTIKNAGPFTRAPFSPQLYSAGSNTDDFYFSLWVMDYKNSLKDIRNVAMFLGFFDLDAGIGWDETSLTTSIRLVERTTMLTGRYNNNTDTAEEILEGSEWQELLNAPAYLGYKPKVTANGRTTATIGGFDAYNKSVKGVIAGIVQSDTLDGTSIQLGKSPALAALVGSSVKLKMGQGGLLTGTITDLGGGNYGINTTGMTLNVAWDSVLVYNRGWTAIGDYLTPGDGGADLGSIFFDNTEPLTKLVSPTMYMKTPTAVEFYSGGVQTSAGPLFIKLTGIIDEANKELSCEPLKDPANPTWPFSGVTVDMDTTSSLNFSDADLIHLNFAKWKAKQTCGLYFSDKTFVLADIQKQGMPWELIVTPHVNAGVVLDDNYYIRLAGDTTIATSKTGQYAIYADNGSKLLPIPNSEIDSLTYNCNDFSLPDLCRIKFKRRLTEINEAYGEAKVYVDTWPPMPAAQCITYIMNEGGIHESLRSYNLRDGGNNLGNPIGVIISDETWTELLESVLFESGLQLDVAAGYYNLSVSFNKATRRTFNNTADSSQKFMFVDTLATINFDDVVDGTYKFNLGRMLTNIDSTKREFVRVHYTYDYPYSYYGGTKLKKLQSTKSVKSNDRTIAYTFKHVVDTPTATAAAIQMQCIGHQANIPEATRIVEVGLPLSYIGYQILDPVRLVNFRHITKLNDPLPAYDDASTTNPTYTLGTFGPYVRYDDTVLYSLLPGIGIVDAIKINLSGSNIPVSLTFKQVQVTTMSNLRSVAERLDLNDEADNTEPEETGGNGAYPGQAYLCPDGTEPYIVISETPAKPSAATVNDPCCNTSSTDGDNESDPRVTVVCVGGCTTLMGCPSDPWDECSGPGMIWTEPLFDSTIGSTDLLWFEILSFEMCPQLIDIRYYGKTDPDICVHVGLDCSGIDTRIGLMSVAPCIFNAPAGVSTKTIILEFLVSYCTLEMPPPTNGKVDYMEGLVKVFKIKKVLVPTTVNLRPVSNGNIS